MSSAVLGWWGGAGGALQALPASAESKGKSLASCGAQPGLGCLCVSRGMLLDA